MKSATLTRLAGSKRTHEASEGNARPISVPSANGTAAPSKAAGNDAAIRAFVDAVVTDWRGASKLLKEEFIISVIHRSREIIMAEPMLVKVDAPTNICGDLHGQIHDLSTILNTGGLPPKSRYLFLGDYVDRGKFGIECMITLLGLKILYPGNMFVLRGNHETDSICRVYGFYDECKRRFNFKLYKQFTDLFNVLPIAANVEDRALCMHGGLSPELHSLNQIAVLRRPMSIGDHGLACDILWSDPDASVTGWGYSERGVSCTFGADVVKRFCNKADIDLIVRAHQVMENGYEFFADRQLVTVFSASNYCGEFTNSGAMIVMDADLRCRFQVFRPEYDRK